MKLCREFNKTYTMYFFQMPFLLVPAIFCPHQKWWALQRLAPDLHFVLWTGYIKQQWSAKAMKAFWFAAWVGKKINRKGFEARRDYYGIIKSDRQQYNYHNLYPLNICPIHSNFLTNNTAASKGLHFWKILWWTLICNINKVKRHKLINRHSEKSIRRNLFLMVLN